MASSAEQQRAWRKRNPEKARANRIWMQGWYERNHDKVVIYRARQHRKEIDELRRAYLKKQARSRKHPTTESEVLQSIQLKRALRIMKPMAVAAIIKPD